MNTNIKQYKKHDFLLTFTLLIAYQFLQIFQGFEVCDSGFYAVFYENIFTNPSFIEYNFLYWFTGIIGGLFVKAFPNTGLLGIRILGVINMSLIMYLVYILLNKNVKRSSLNIGLSIVVFSHYGTPPEFFHNNLSALLFIGASCFIYRGLNNNSLLDIGLAGPLLALNAFTRLPNILDIGIIIIIIAHTYILKSPIKSCIQKIATLLSSYLASILLILLIMKLIGHYEIFINNIIHATSAVSGKTGNTHNFKNLISINLVAYKNILKQGLYLTTLLLIIATIDNLKITQKKKAAKILFSTISFGILIVFLQKAEAFNIIYWFSIIALTASIGISSNNIKTLSLIGLYMLIVMPIGSDFSIYNFRSPAIWLAVPLAINFFSTEKIAIKATINQNQKSLDFNIEKTAIDSTLILFLSALSLLFIYKGITTCYFDPGNRIKKNHRINSEKTKFIFTSRERAIIINDVLAGIKPYINKGDYLIAYESIPMLHYITGTIPFLHDSWLMNSASHPLAQKIERAQKENRPLPLVLRQKFETIIDFGKPSEEYISNNRPATIFVSEEQTKIFNNFLKVNKYKTIWENTYFILYEPENFTKKHSP